MQKLSDVKFDIDQKVFIMSENKVRKMIVREIDRRGECVRYSLADSESIINGVHENRIFGTTEDLIESITEGL